MSTLQKFILAHIAGALVLAIFVIGSINAGATPVDPETAQAAITTTTQGDFAKAAGYISISITMLGAIIGTGFAVGKIGSSAIGAISEKPELAGRALIFVGLAEGIAIYGVLISFLILQALK